MQGLQLPCRTAVEDVKNVRSLVEAVYFSHPLIDGQQGVVLVGLLPRSEDHYVSPADYPQGAGELTRMGSPTSQSSHEGF